jgi:alanyl-tRNA synthetase
MDVPLATAREIRGVRAVFGETYPDPVRVVSVGVPVEELLSDVKREEWEKVSVEFCGGTHVKHTGEIKELIILEESGIAKGIRRIVAVTGQTAYAVQREASEFEERLALMEKTAYSSSKEADAKKLGQELNNLNISAITKSQFRDRFSKVQKSILDQQKAAAKADNKRVLDTIVNFFSENEMKNHLVAKVDWSPTVNKAISEAIKSVSGKGTMKEKSVYLFSASEDEGKVVHGCYVAKVRFLIPLAILYNLFNAKLTRYSTSPLKAPPPRNGPRPSPESLAARQVGKARHPSAREPTLPRSTRAWRRLRSTLRSSSFELP